MKTPKTREKKRKTHKNKQIVRVGPNAGERDEKRGADVARREHKQFLAPVPPPRHPCHHMHVTDINLININVTASTPCMSRRAGRPFRANIDYYMIIVIVNHHYHYYLSHDYCHCQLSLSLFIRAPVQSHGTHDTRAEPPSARATLRRHARQDKNGNPTKSGITVLSSRPGRPAKRGATQKARKIGILELRVMRMAGEGFRV